jgi:phospholipid/cholesterol/gamma-HCH transport system ATP-binding protein
MTDQSPDPALPILEFRDVWRKFGDKTVLAGINLAIFRGEVLVILGGSGSGKSVTLRQMNGLDHPDKGQVLLDGEDITTLSEAELWNVRRRVGMLFQSGALFDSMTVFENVAFALREHTPMTDAEIAHRVREVLGLVNLGPEVEPLPPSSLSGGMKKRVSLARTIALQPEVLMYDEPTTGLDPVTAMTINRLIVDLNTRLSTTSIVVTHDIASALFVADRIAFLKQGQFVFTGTKAEAKNSSVPELRAFLEAQEDEPVEIVPSRPRQELA